MYNNYTNFENYAWVEETVVLDMTYFHLRKYILFVHSQR